MKLGEPFGKDMKMEKGKLRKENTYRKEQESKQKAKKKQMLCQNPGAWLQGELNYTFLHTTHNSWEERKHSEWNQYYCLI